MRSRFLQGVTVGALQLTVLKHSLAIHAIRQAAIPEHLRLHKYRLAMWEDKRKSDSARRYAREQANKKTAAAPASDSNSDLPPDDPSAAPAQGAAPAEDAASQRGSATRAAAKQTSATVRACPIWGVSISAPVS
jgi:hypothetical protein